MVRREQPERLLLIGKQRQAGEAQMDMGETLVASAPRVGCPAKLIDERGGKDAPVSDREQSENARLFPVERERGNACGVHREVGKPRPTEDKTIASDFRAKLDRMRPRLDGPFLFERIDLQHQIPPGFGPWDLA